MTTTYTNLGLIKPQPNDTSVANAWGTLLNTNETLIDGNVAGILALNVAGNTNIQLTFTNGSPSQTSNIFYNCTGVLTGAVVVILPAGVTKFFIAQNGATGAHALSFGVNNGSGSPAGTTVTVPQGASALCYSDGTNVVQVGTAGPDGSIWSSTGISGLVSLQIGNLVTPAGVALTATTTGGNGGVYAAEFTNQNNNNTGDARGILVIGGNNGGGGGSQLASFRSPDGTALGSITQTGIGTIQLNTSSDYRIKTVKGEFCSSGAIIDAVPVHLAKITADDRPFRAMFLAHEVQAQVPLAVVGEKDAVDENGKPIIQQLDHSALVPILWAEIRELRKRIAALEESKRV